MYPRFARLHLRSLRSAFGVCVFVLVNVCSLSLSLAIVVECAGGSLLSACLLGTCFLACLSGACFLVLFSHLLSSLLTSSLAFSWYSPPITLTCFLTLLSLCSLSLSLLVLSELPLFECSESFAAVRSYSHSSGTRSSYTLARSHPSCSRSFFSLYNDKLLVKLAVSLGRVGL